MSIVRGIASGTSRGISKGIGAIAGGGFSPDQLTPNLWLDAVNGEFTQAIDNNGTRARGNFASAILAETGQSFTNAGTLGTMPVYNGEGFYFESGASLTNGVAGDWNFLHNGSDFDIFYVLKQNSAQSGNGRYLISTNGVSGSAPGVLLNYDNTSGLNKLRFRIMNGTLARIDITANNAITQNADNVIWVRRTGNTTTLYVNWVQVGTQTASGYTTADSQALFLNSSVAATSTNYLKDVVFFDRNITVDELALMQSRTFTSITPEAVNVYIDMGDSMCQGRGLNSNIASDLIAVIPGATTVKYDSSNPTKNSWIGKLHLGVNQAVENVTTQHSAEMRFCKTMGALKDTVLIKYGIGSTDLINDWNPNTPGLYFTRGKTAILESLKEVVHVYRKTPVFRGFIWLQGPNDGVVGGTALSWTRSGSTITVTQANHPLLTGDILPITASSDTGAIPLGQYSPVTKTGANTFTFIGVATGATSGTLTYSAGSIYKSLFYTFINSLIDYIQTTLVNEEDGTAGYTVDKLRLALLRIAPSSLYDNSAPSYADTRQAQEEIAANYLTDNPARSANVLGSTYMDTDGYATIASDTLHLNAASNDTLGANLAAYFDDYINE